MVGVLEDNISFKNTVWGLIPTNWELKDLKGIAKVIDSLHETPSFSSEGYPMVRVSDIKPGLLNLVDTERVSNDVYLKFTRNYEPKKGDIVLSRVGSYGVPSYVATNRKFCLGQNTVVITTHLSSKYLYYALSSTFVFRQIELGSFGSGYKSLSLKNIRELKIPLPPTKAEQTAIATALSDMDALIEAQEKLIAKKRAIKQGAMEELLRPKEGWVEKKLGEVCSITTGDKDNKDKAKNGDYPFFVRSANVERINSWSYDGEAILVPGDGNVGEIFHYINGKFDFHQRVYKLSDFQGGYDGKFIYLTLAMFFKEHALKYTAKNTVDSLRRPIFTGFVIDFPKYNEQKQIAGILSDMDSEIEQLEVQLEKYMQLKTGMMQDLLTGKKRLV